MKTETERDYTSTGQGVRRVVGSHGKPRERGMEQIFPQSLSKEPHCKHLDAGFWPPKLREYKFQLFKGTRFVVICYSNEYSDFLVMFT